jgi:hypothetical protein
MCPAVQRAVAMIHSGDKDDGAMSPLAWGGWSRLGLAAAAAALLWLAVAWALGW